MKGTLAPGFGGASRASLLLAFAVALWGCTDSPPDGLHVKYFQNVETFHVFFENTASDGKIFRVEEVVVQGSEDGKDCRYVPDRPIEVRLLSAEEVIVPCTIAVSSISAKIDGKWYKLPGK